METPPTMPRSEPSPGYTSSVDSPPTPVVAERKRVPRLAIESLLIVLSVFLGFAANQWNERRSERALAAQAIASFRQELKQNLAILDSVQPRHNVMANRLDSAAKARSPGLTAFDAFIASMPNGGVSVPLVVDAAWQTAVSTGALRLLSYERVAQLSETYEAQRAVIGSTGQRLEDRLSSPQNFDPASREQMLRVQGLLFHELSGQETFLKGVYRRALVMLDSIAK